jgi:hypothetical protein
MFTYVYLHTFIYANKGTHIYIYIYICIFTYFYLCKYTVPISVISKYNICNGYDRCNLSYIYIYSYKRIYIHTYIYAYRSIYIYIYKYMYIHIYIQGYHINLASWLTVPSILSVCIYVIYIRTACIYGNLCTTLCLIGRVYVFYVGRVDKSSLFHLMVNSPQHFVPGRFYHGYYTLVGMDILQIRTLRMYICIYIHIYKYNVFLMAYRC